MHNAVLSKQVFDFLIDLEKNNNREWFDAHKTTFKTLEAQVKEKFEAISVALSSHDELSKTKLFRVYRDVRFSKDKTPYKAHFAGSFTRAGAALRGGYYIHLKPNSSFIAAGFWAPDKNDLFRIRKEWEMDSSELRDILAEKKFKGVWGELEGEELKTAPKGFDKEDPNIDLIRKKQFIFSRKLTDNEVMSPEFIHNVAEYFSAIRPFFDLMSDILTTDINGQSLL